jgi:hypothetical protein
MFDVVLDLKNLSVPALATRIKAIITATQGEPVFTSLSGKLTALEAKVTALETKQTAQITAQNAAIAATEGLNAAERAVIEGAIDLASDVGKLATTEMEVNATLMRVKNAPAPRPVPNQPTGLELKMGDADGEISGQCNGQPGIVDYHEIQYTTSDPLGPNPNWLHADTSKKSRFDLENMPSGQKIWVRLRACNARGKSNWSDPACIRVP